MRRTTELPEYIIADPTGNITALVTGAVKPEERAEVASAILDKEPLAEQLGFLSETDLADIELYMAGGEFCGNATMSAAAFYAGCRCMNEAKVHIKVSGTREPVNVSVKKNPDNSWSGTVSMPLPLSIESVRFKDGNEFPVVHFPGVDHIIRTVKPGEEINRQELENKIKQYCLEMESLCTGIMNYCREDETLIPLVYVPGADTLFWEHSCASGTSAVGAWLAKESGGEEEACLNEPGGILRIKADGRELLLSGSVRFL